MIMGKKKKKQSLDQYVRGVTGLMSKYESLTSHVLLAYLYFVHNIYPWHLIPQPTSERGIIDFFYLPAEHNFNVFVEMKKFHSLNNQKISSASKYLKVKFPKALKNLKRTDGVRLLIVTDLQTISVSIRTKQWGRTSKSDYTLHIPGKPGEECSQQVAAWLGKTVGDVSRIITWDNEGNRFDFINEKLKKRDQDLFKSVYKVWLKKMNTAGGRGWPAKFSTAYRAKCGMTGKIVPSDHIDAIEETFGDSRIKAAVKKAFEQESVVFKQGPMKSIFA